MRQIALYGALSISIRSLYSRSLPYLGTFIPIAFATFIPSRAIARNSLPALESSMITPKVLPVIPAVALIHELIMSFEYC